MAHADELIVAATDGELWNTTVTIIPDISSISDYIQAALNGQAAGKELPFVIINKSTDEVVGTTRFYDISAPDRKAAIGYTWLSLSAQRTAIRLQKRTE
jgi:RimJ/RimL family protein N-acetyltransferase